jgi:predicted phosphodiesterase
MKIGIISDIHNNIIALKEVLGKFQSMACDDIICCGDILGIGPLPEETVQKIIENKNIISVCGNHDHGGTTINHNDKLYVNVGALGCDNSGASIGKYGILTIQNGECEFEQLEFEYEMSKVTEAINRLKYPAYENILNFFYGMND